MDFENISPTESPTRRWLQSPRFDRGWGGLNKGLMTCPSKMSIVSVFQSFGQAQNSVLAKKSLSSITHYVRSKNVPRSTPLPLLLPHLPLRAPFNTIRLHVQLTSFSSSLPHSPSLAVALANLSLLFAVTLSEVDHSSASLCSYSTLPKLIDLRYRRHQLDAYSSLPSSSSFSPSIASIFYKEHNAKAPTGPVVCRGMQSSKRINSS